MHLQGQKFNKLNVKNLFLPDKQALLNLIFHMFYLPYGDIYVYSHFVENWLTVCLHQCN